MPTTSIFRATHPRLARLPHVLAMVAWTVLAACSESLPTEPRDGASAADDAPVYAKSGFGPVPCSQAIDAADLVSWQRSTFAPIGKVDIAWREQTQSLLITDLGQSGKDGVCMGFDAPGAAAVGLGLKASATEILMESVELFTSIPDAEGGTQKAALAYTRQKSGWLLSMRTSSRSALAVQYLRQGVVVAQGTIDPQSTGAYAGTIVLGVMQAFPQVNGTLVDLSVTGTTVAGAAHPVSEWRQRFGGATAMVVNLGGRPTVGIDEIRIVDPAQHFMRIQALMILAATKVPHEVVELVPHTVIF